MECVQIITASERSAWGKVCQRLYSITGYSHTKMTPAMSVLTLKIKEYFFSVIQSPERHWTTCCSCFIVKHQSTGLQPTWSYHLIRHGGPAALDVSTHSPDFPCSPSDFIPSSEGSFPRDSRICQVSAGDSQDWHEDKIKKRFSFPKQVQLKKWACLLSLHLNPAQLTPGNTSRGCRRVFPSLSLPVLTASHRFSDTVHLAPPPSVQMIYWGGRGGAHSGCH